MQLSVSMLSLLFVLSFTSLFAQEASPNPVFTTYEHDFGDLKEGEKREFIFEFVNEGTIPFIISKIHVQCGCTAPEWSDKPVLPHEKGQIKIVYNSSGKEGIQRKIVSVKSNYHELIKLKIVANVLTD